MQKYRSHKVVEAAKIVFLSSVPELPDTMYVYVVGSITPVRVSSDWSKRLFRGSAADMGYLVRYGDGYMSWSPSKAFEEGYTLVNTRDPLNHDTSEAGIEAAIQAAGKTAPRLSPVDIDAAIVKEDYYVFPGTTVTVCCLTLRNGFNTIGYSAAASPDNFDEQIGRDVAHRNARDKIWSLEGYLLKEKLHQGAWAELEATKARIDSTLSASPNITHRHENIKD